MAYDYEQTHERILESAMVHFKEKGFAGASIRQICKDAGVTNGAFYAHFDSKEELFNELVRPAIDGMQELYDEENEYYMDIKSAKDIKKVMKQTFSSNSRLIHYVYEHMDAFGLIITASAGTEYEYFLDRMSEVEASNTMEFIEKCRPFIKDTKKISKGLIKQTSHFVVSSVFEGLTSGKTEEEVIYETELASEFCLAGMKYIMGI